MIKKSITIKKNKLRNLIFDNEKLKQNKKERNHKREISIYGINRTHNSCNLLFEMKKKLKSINKSNDILKSQINLFQKARKRKIKKDVAVNTKIIFENTKLVQNVVIKIFDEIKMILDKFENNYNYLFNENFDNLEEDLNFNFDSDDLLIKSLNFTKNILKNEMLNQQISKVNISSQNSNPNFYRPSFRKFSKIDIKKINTENELSETSILNKKKKTLKENNTNNIIKFKPKSYYEINYFK